jgi:hypothetical protein
VGAGLWSANVGDSEYRLHKLVRGQDCISIAPGGDLSKGKNPGSVYSTERISILVHLGLKTRKICFVGLFAAPRS